MSRPPPPIAIARTVEDVRSQVSAWRAQRLRVALVPTMGALHDGHLSLVRLGLKAADRVVVSLFVNPAQFAPHEDFDAYPRDEQSDAQLLTKAGCHLLYAPTALQMYPLGFATTLRVSGVSAPLEGEHRPHFFEGVATVVAKLLIQAGPDMAVFGEKDYQQLQVIRRMVRDLDMPTEILGAPTERADDGLALSSRNAYLTAEQRVVAGRLNRILAKLAQDVAAGRPIAEAEAGATQALLAAGFDRIDYIAVRHADDLGPLGPGPIGAAPGRVLAAAWLGKTRLIDNMVV